MKKYLIPNLRALLEIVLFFASSCAFAQVNSDAVLYGNGYKNYTNRNWVYASIYLFAYIQRNPKELAIDEAFKKEITKAFDFTMDRLNEQVAELNNLKKSQARNQNNAGVGSSQQGLSTPPPPLRQPSTVSKGNQK
jgi:hypothetical protein